MKINKYILWGMGIILLGGVGLFVMRSGAEQLPPPKSEVLSENGLHWHPQIEIFIKGEKQEIPVNIGIGSAYAAFAGFDLGMQMTAMHTHDANGIIHLEFPGLVTKEDTKLGNFFAIWGKDFREFGSSVTMTVNGEANSELENYQMKDGDNIELRYE